MRVKSKSPSNAASATCERNAYLREVRREGMNLYGFGVKAARQIKICPKCGASASTALCYCPSCGSKLPQANLYEIVTKDKPHCPHCGVVLTGRERYCPRCGK